MTYSKFILFVITTIAVFSSCNFNRTYMPELNGKQEAIIDSIDTKYRFENINLQGRKTSGTGGTHTSLTVDFINGKNIPSGDDKITVLAKKLAIQIRQTLKNPKEFESYIIRFDDKVVNGNTTTTNYVGHEFKASEL